MLDKQRQEYNPVIVSTVLFSNDSKVIHDRVPLSEVADLTKADYHVGGCTALLDAVGGAIKHISNVHKYIREEDRPKKTLFVITTDGMENASQKYNYSQVKEMIDAKTKQEEWEFIFLGANIDASAEAERLGINRKNAARYCCDSEGTQLNFKAVGDVVSDCCFGGSFEGWQETIEAYQKRREGKK